MNSENKNKNIKQKNPFKPCSKPSKKQKSIFKTSKKESPFLKFYKSNPLPCKIEHGSIQNKLVWDKNFNINNFNYNPFILYFYDGLQETQHPYNFICIEAIKFLMVQKKALKNVFPLKEDLVKKIRVCLVSKNSEVFLNGLLGVTYLSGVLGSEMNCFIKSLLSPIGKKLNGKKFKNKILKCLGVLEENGGKEAYLIIKRKIPTYCSVL